MVKGQWVLVAFIGGVTVGVVATRMAEDTRPLEVVQGIDPPAASHVDAPGAPSLSTHDVSPALSARAQPASADMNSRLATSAPGIARAVLPDAPAPVDDAGIQHIDAGEVFNKAIAREPQPGFENQIGDAHRELERETRDDGWSYPMEAEIQNSMVNEVSTGAFRAEHVECRATLCEVRLSGKGEEGEALKRWSEDLGKQPFGQRLFLNYSSSISNNDRVDMLMIFRRPPKPN